MLEEDDTYLNEGIQTIRNAFNQQRERYINIIQSQQNKIATLTQQIESLQLDNQKILYQLESLKQKLFSLTSSSLLMKKDNTNDDNICFLYNNIPKKKENNILTCDTTPINNYPIVMSPSNHNNTNNSNIHIINSNVPNVRKQIMNSHSFITTRTNKSNLSIHTDLNSFNNNISVNTHHNNSQTKHNSIRQRINSLRTDNERNSFINNRSSDNEEEFERRGNENKSMQYQKTNYFLKECKMNLNASNFEKLLKVLKENKNDGEDSTMKMKIQVYNILNVNEKLKKMFDSIYS